MLGIRNTVQAAQVMGSLQVPVFEIRDFVVDLAKQGGQIILAAKPSDFNNSSKKNSASLISRASLFG